MNLPRDPYARAAYSIGAAEGFMRVINFSYARNQLKQVIDQVVDGTDFTVIARRDARDAVVMSLDTFNSLMETLQLMKSPANAKHLEKSISQYRKGQSKTKELIDAKSTLSPQPRHSKRQHLLNDGRH